MIGLSAICRLAWGLSVLFLLAATLPSFGQQAARGKTVVAFDPNVWVDASRSYVKVGDLVVLVQKVAVQHIDVVRLERSTQTTQKFLLIEMGVGNLSSTKKVDYTGWHALDAARRPVLALLEPSVTDNFGNTYSRIKPDIFTDIVFQVRTASIHPDRMLTDRLVFELPIDRIKHLRVRLPTAGMGLDTKPIQFEIPDTMIDWPGREVEPPPKEAVLTIDELSRKGRSLVGKRIALQGTATMAPVGKTLVFIDFEARGVHLASALVPTASLDLPRRFTFRQGWRYTLRLRANVARVGAGDVVYLDDVAVLNQISPNK